MLQLDRNALVWGITGNLGGGKSLSAVYFAVNAILDGYFVCSNITIKTSLLPPWASRLYQHLDLNAPDFDPFKLPCGDPRGSGGNRRVLVIIDECAEWFDQYANAKDPRIQRLWSWLRHSSKRSQDVFLIVQRPEYLHKVMRILIARWLLVDDLAVFRLPYFRIKVPFCSGLVVCRPFDRQGNRVGGCEFIRKSKWGQYYDTAECLNSDGSKYNLVYLVPERKFNHPFVTFAFVASSLFCLFLYFKGLRFRAVVRQRLVEASSAVGACAHGRGILPFLDYYNIVYVGVSHEQETLSASLLCKCYGC